MAKVLSQVRCIIVVDPATGDPSSVTVAYTFMDGEEKGGGIHTFVDPDFGRTAETWAADAIQKAKELEGIE